MENDQLAAAKARIVILELEATKGRALLGDYEARIAELEAEVQEYAKKFFSVDRQLTARVNDLDAVLFERTDLRTKLAELEQMSGDECQECHWAGDRGHGCEFCALREAKDRIEKLSNDIASLVAQNENKRIKIEHLEEQNTRLMSRGIEDMHTEITHLTRIIEHLRDLFPEDVDMIEEEIYKGIG